MTIEENFNDKNQEDKTSRRKIAIVDTVGNMAYSLITGTALDYASGLDLTGIIASRTSATAINSVTGSPYGWWREKVFRTTKTTKESSRTRKTLSDLLAFNSFQVPVYGTALAIGSLVSEGDVNMEKVGDGMKYLASISPLIAPTMGLFMDGLRKIFKINTASQGAYNDNLPSE